MSGKSPHKLRFAVLATDIALFRVFDKKLHVLLVRVHRPPHFIHKWGLPGGLIHPKETADKAAVRLLREKGEIRDVYIEQLYTFSEVKRDPRGRVVSVAYIGLVPENKVLRLDDDSGIRWYSVRELPKLAYDHNEIIRAAVERMQGKLEYTNIVCNLLPR
ncbi:NUDIX hydrolase, partial [Patescibacteria group bacterium]|nr:NUDIX hydrolase [Patescibacteria group bacterium]